MRCLLFKYLTKKKGLHSFWMLIMMFRLKLYYQQILKDIL